MRRLLRGKLGKRGDTLVEVLMALAISSLVIGAAMATAQRSLATSIASQERGEALKIAETQVERLRATGLVAIGTRTSFCFNGATLQSGTCSISGLGIAYATNITRPSTSSNRFLVTITWDRVGSTRVQQLTLRYAIY